LDVVADQAREVMAALNLSKTQLAEVLWVIATERTSFCTSGREQVHEPRVTRGREEPSGRTALAPAATSRRAR
jgi:hypothetical protein